MDWLWRMSVGEWLTAGVLCSSVAGWAIRQHIRMNRAADDVVLLRNDLQTHLKEADGLIQRFIGLEREAEDMDRRLDELLAVVRSDRDRAREDRRDMLDQIMTSIEQMRVQVDARLADLKDLIYQTVADRRKA